MEQIIFDSSYLLRTGYFTTLIAAIHTFLDVFICFCHSKSGSRPFFEEYYYCFNRRTCSHPFFLDNYFSIRYYSCFLEYLQSSILSTLLCIFLMLKFVLIQFSPTLFLSTYLRRPVNMKQTYYRSSYFFKAALLMMKWEQPHEAATFSQKYFFSEYLVAWSSYFLHMTTSW